jgi:hypothetical protein
MDLGALAHCLGQDIGHGLRLVHGLGHGHVQIITCISTPLE